MIKNLSEEQQNIVLNAQKTLPVDIGSLCKDFGITAYISDLGNKISGQIVKDEEEKSGFVIFVSDTDNKKRQRFTAAHELSHFLLHKNQIGDGIVDSPLYRSKLANKIEVEANKLAADILMPHDKINTKIDDGVDTISGLADYFGVSLQAMKVRLGIPI